MQKVLIILLYQRIFTISGKHIIGRIKWPYSEWSICKKQLVKEEWLYKFRVDKENYMEFFIFAHPDSIAYAKRYNIVFRIGLHIQN